MSNKTDYSRMIQPIIKMENDIDELSQHESNEDLQSEVMMQSDSECIISQFEEGSELGMMHSLENGSEMLSASSLSPNMGFLLENGDDDNEDSVLMQHMDIRAPLSKLKTLLEKRLGVELDGYDFWLQDAQILEAHKNLVDQCVQGKGLVQINVQIRTITKRINIVDVLKPHDEYVDGSDAVNEEQNMDDDVENEDDNIPQDKNVIKWVVDDQFKKDQIRLKIPEDPTLWSCMHVRHWILWAVRQFKLLHIHLKDWNITGKALFEMTHREFQTKVTEDPKNVFWTHLELLRKCKFVAILQKDNMSEAEQNMAIIRKTQKNIHKPKIQYKLINELTMVDLNKTAGANRTGNNGQIQLWQFLLEILTDKDHRNAIQWIGTEGEFKLNNPEYVAQLWGHRKNKPTMNYEKLSRALRYYYDGDMISKVHGKRFVYKFVCDLKQVIGFNAGELAKLVYECSQNAQDNVNYVWRM